MCCFKQRLQMFMFQTNLKIELFFFLFDSGAQLSYVSPKVKAFLNPEIEVRKEVALKTFGENTGYETDVVELVVPSKSTEKGITLQAFVTDIYQRLKNQTQNLQRKTFHILGI